MGTLWFNKGSTNTDNKVSVIGRLTKSRPIVILLIQKIVNRYLSIYLFL